MDAENDSLDAAAARCRRAEQTAKECAERLKRISQALSNYVFTVRVEHGRAVRTEHGTECEKITGYTGAEFAADPGLWLRMVVEADRQAVIEHGRTMLSGRLPAPLEHRIVRKDGKTRWVRNTLAPHFDPQGRLLYYDGIVQDVTERKRDELTLEDQNAKLTAILGVVQSGIVVIDAATHRIVNANKAAMELIGAGLDRIIGAECWEFLCPAKRGECPASDLGRTVDKTESVLITASGEKLPIITSVKAIDMRNERFLVQSFLDISKFKETAERLAQSEAQLRHAQKMEAVGRLAGGVAHDFNNLLTAISGYSDFLLNNGSLDKSQRADVIEIKEAGTRAASLTRQLLAFSRKQVLELKVMDINAIVGGAQSLLRRLIGEDIELTILFDKRPIRATVDRGYVEQVLVNLAVNARDAMPEGGKLAITVGRTHLTEAHVHRHGTVPPGRYVQLAVTDTGCGMDQGVQSHLFEPFYTTKERGKGTGLGLSTIYGIVTQMGGHITAYSEPGKGTSFNVYFPLVASGAETAEPMPEPEELFAGTATILLVEDEAQVRNLTKRILKADGFTVLEAGCGEEALAICESHKDPIHLLLTDMIMPGMSGPELARTVSELRPEIKMFFMSGYTDHPVLKHSMEGLSKMFIQKPFSADSLRRALRTALLIKEESAPRTRARVQPAISHDA